MIWRGEAREGLLNTPCLLCEISQVTDFVFDRILLFCRRKVPQSIWLAIMMKVMTFIFKQWDKDLLGQMCETFCISFVFTHMY